MTKNTIEVEALQEMLDQGQAVTVLDIRHSSDRAEWAIPDSMHIDAYDALKAHDPNALAGVALPADRPVVAICNAGVTSLIAAEQLRARGLQALSLVGGMQAWSLAWNSAEVPLPDDSAARVIQIRRTGKGCLSYLIGSNGVAAVVDPALDPEIYIELARQNDWTINSVIDTHIHADHLSRARKLAEQSGATLYLPAQERVSYPFKALQDGDVLEIGTARLVALRTPGHTMESSCYLLDGHTLLTGDTLFLAGIGRPDLEASAEETQARAHLLYHSLQRLLTLPAETLILPGHASEPVAFDGKAMAASLAEVRKRTEFLAMPEETLVEVLLARIPPTPPNHHRIVELNEAGMLPESDLTELEAGANRCAIN